MENTEEKPKKKMSRKQKIAIVGCFVFALVLLVVGSWYIDYNFDYGVELIDHDMSLDNENRYNPMADFTATFENIGRHKMKVDCHFETSWTYGKGENATEYGDYETVSAVIEPGMTHTFEARLMAAIGTTTHSTITWDDYKVD